MAVANMGDVSRSEMETCKMHVSGLQTEDVLECKHGKYVTSASKDCTVGFDMAPFKPIPGQNEAKCIHRP